MMNIFKTRSNRPDARGFTVLEVLISAIIISVGLMALVSMHVAATKGNVSGERISVATQIAYSKMAELKSLMYYLDVTGSANIQIPDLYMDPKLSAQQVDMDVTGAGAPCTEGQPCLYKLMWSITDGPDSPQTRGAYKEIRVTVSYKDSDLANAKDIVIEARRPVQFK